MSDQTPTTPAGWYPDPQNPVQQRYWDGTAWAAAAPPPTAAAPPPATAAPPPTAAAPPPAPVATRPTSTNAVIGLVLAIGSWFICPIIAAIPALFLARSSDKEIAASGGTIGGSGMNKATRIVAWINIIFYAAFGVIIAIFAALGIGFFASVASSVNPTVNTQTGLSDGEYVMDTTSSLVINDECTFSGEVFAYDNLDGAPIKEATVYGQGPAECGLGTSTQGVYFEVVGGVAKIIEVG